MEPNGRLASHGERAQAGAANERLVRHYVQLGVLTPPDREGREALFGLRQVVEFPGGPLPAAGRLAARQGRRDRAHHRRYYGRTADDLMDPFRAEFELLNALCARRLRSAWSPRRA